MLGGIETITLVAVFIFDKSNILAFIQPMQRISHVVHNTARFIIHYNLMSWEFDNYAKIWDGAEFRSHVLPAELPECLTISSVSMNAPNLHLAPSSTGISLRMRSVGKQERVLICGDSGHGKTTFVNALTGLIPGITFANDSVTPESVAHHFITFSQVITKYMPTKGLTYREIFNAKPACMISAPIARECCRIACIDHILDKSPNDAPDCAKNIWFDECMRVGLSGGEMTRLALATVLFEARMSSDKTRPLVLDEPDQSLSEADRDRLIASLMDAIDDRTMIIITHHPGARQKFKWTKIITARDLAISCEVC